ncbi:MAG: hypothetical protein GX946_02700 [Oligosphaeraceae bacterium]|nr:hypothetical protein [Oligosphaeraceae bacterium]
MKLFLSSLLAILVTGCSIFRSPKQTVTITATPPDSVIFVNGQTVQSPAILSMRRDEDVRIKCIKDGYYPSVHVIGHSLSTTGILDIIGLVLIILPGAGLFTAGAWSLDETSVDITLVPMPNN